MAPPCLSINASELPARVQEDLKGKRRKLDVGQKGIRLSDCELLAMAQYKCEVQRPLTKESPVLCYAVDRLFRRCKDRNGTFMVETTAWEGSKAGGSGASSPRSSSSSSSKPHQWNLDDYDSKPLD